jgi:hypothetical protein
MTAPSFIDAARVIHAQSMQMALNAPEFQRASKCLTDPYMMDHVLSQYWSTYNTLVWCRDFFNAMAPYEEQVLAMIAPTVQQHINAA